MFTTRAANEQFLQLKAASILPTCFVCGDGELVAGLALADEILGKHADVVGGRRVEVDDGGLVELRGHVLSLLSSVPGGWAGKQSFIKEACVNAESALYPGWFDVVK